MQRALHKNGHLVITLTIVIALAISVGVIILVRMYRNSEVTSVDSAGGTASSADDQVNVTFAPGEFSADTHVKILNDDRRAPLLPPGLVPIVPPFSIAPEDSGAHTGTVTVSYPELPDTIDPESIVMSITDGTIWEVVDTTVNIEARTVTAQWPHFSWGVAWVPSPEDILNGVQAFYVENRDV